MAESLRSHEVQSITGKDQQSSVAAGFDYDANRFPYSIVWQPFPVLGWILPCIGHMGIADSSGVIYDFQGPYTIMCVNIICMSRSTQRQPP